MKVNFYSTSAELCQNIAPPSIAGISITKLLNPQCVFILTVLDKYIRQLIWQAIRAFLAHNFKRVFCFKAEPVYTYSP